MKPVFDLAACPEILADVSRHGRETIVVCGLETDVCVAQSALGLLEAGKRVVVVEDAVASPGTAHEQGLARMSRGGVELIGVKGLAYEWLGTVERATAVRRRHRARRSRRHRALSAQCYRVRAKAGS